MATEEPQKILSDLKKFVGEELKCVSYKWLARHYNIPTNFAKQILFQFAEAHRGKINVTYLLAGWTKETQQHTFQILDEKDVQDGKKKLSAITSMHVHSVQPSQPKDASDLWNADAEQASVLFDNMVKKMEQNCLSENKLSSIVCPGAKRDPQLAQKVPAPPMPEQEPPKQSKAVARKIDSVVAGSTANKRGVAATSMTVAGDQSQAPKDSLIRGPSSAPAQGSKGKPPVKKTGSGESKVAKMFEKAPKKGPKQQSKAVSHPAKKAKIEPEESPKAESPESKGSDAEEEEEQLGSIKRKASKQAVFDEESESEDEVPASKGNASQKRNSKKKAEKPPSKKARAATVDDDEDDVELDLTGGDKSQGREQESSQEGGKKDKGATQKKKANPKAAFGSVKSGPATGSRRCKVTRTTINSKGEEVTEEVWEEDSNAAESQDGDPRDNTPAGETEEDKTKVSSQEQHKAKPAPAKAAAKKSAPSPAKPAAKKSAASGKAKPAGQKGIMSFFAKR